MEEYYKIKQMYNIPTVEFFEVSIENPDFSYKTKLNIYKYKILTNSKGEKTLVIILMIQKLKTKKIKYHLLFENNLLNELKNFGEIEYITKISCKSNKIGYLTLFEVNKFTDVNVEMNTVKEIFNLSKNNNIYYKKIRYEIIKGSYKNISEEVFNRTRKVAYYLKNRYKKVSLLSIQNITYCIANNKIKEKEVDKIAYNIYDFIQNKWFKTEKERKLYHYHKNKILKSKETKSKNISKARINISLKKVYIIKNKIKNIKNITVKKIINMIKDTNIYLCKTTIYKYLKLILSDINTIKNIDNYIIKLFKDLINNKTTLATIPI